MDIYEVRKCVTEFCRGQIRQKQLPDDLQDKDEIRRGQQAVWKAFGPETAINLGDFFIAGTFQALAEIDESPDLRVIECDSNSQGIFCVLVGSHNLLIVPLSF